MSCLVWCCLALSGVFLSCLALPCLVLPYLAFVFARLSSPLSTWFGTTTTSIILTRAMGQTHSTNLNPNLSPNPNPYPNSWTYHKHNKWQRFVIDKCEDAYCLLPTEAFVRVTIHASKRRATRVFATSKGNWTVTLCVCEVYVWWCRWRVRLTLTPQPRC